MLKKICAVFALSLPYPTVFLSQRNCLPCRDQLTYGGKTINVSFEEFKGKDTFFARELSRHKGLEKLCEMSES